VPAHDIEKFVVEQIHRIGTDDALVAEAVTKARAENEERLRVLQRDQETLRRELHGLSEQERKLVKTMADVGEMSGTETRQLADVQERIEQIRRRSTELREEVVTVSGELVTEREMAAAYPYSARFETNSRRANNAG
jgi:septal ring factor EnvC (AmiA/AmiB activator)